MKKERNSSGDVFNFGLRNGGRRCGEPRYNQRKRGPNDEVAEIFIPSVISWS